MSIQKFIKLHRAELDSAIAKMLNHEKNPRPTDAERRLWILNNESLYQWAKSEGVRI